MPPAMRKLARLIPSAWSIGLPSNAKNIRIAQAISEERIAMARRCSGVAPLVRLAKMGAQPGGSIITRKVTSADPNSSIIAWPLLFRWCRHVVDQDLRVTCAGPLEYAELAAAVLVDLPVPTQGLVGRLAAAIVVGRGARLLVAQRRRRDDRRSGRFPAADSAVELCGSWGRGHRAR